eukprot:TRINITY_DN112511_c0_g1_i1.p2 TRINITY_DN112511_c0_g1~~TRINITY_DN112511_c0_g1_i1.p2  ORF type:complete len:141 (-),score=35.49 TRINITY_DN112511_c0_g1_i1:266-688(-)
MKWLRRALVLVPAISAVRVDDDEDAEGMVGSATGESSEFPSLGSIGSTVKSDFQHLWDEVSGGRSGSPGHHHAAAPAKGQAQHSTQHEASHEAGEKVVSEHAEPGKESAEHQKTQVESEPAVSSGSKHLGSTAASTASKR